MGQTAAAIGQRLVRELKQELEADILPWWRKFRDVENGGFFGLIRNDGTVDPRHDKGLVMHSRFLWAYSAAFRFDGDRRHLDLADHARSFLIDTLHDKKNGGFHWLVSFDGKPTVDRKVIYGQAFAIYALSQHYRATAATESLDLALATFDLLESSARDRRYGGYFEACTHDWSGVLNSALSDVDIACDKSMNTNLHVLEALATLLMALKGSSGTVYSHRVPEVREALASLIDVHLDKIRVTPEHMTLYYNKDWSPISDTISYGHDVEASWLIWEAAETAWGHGEVPARVRDATLAMAGRAREILESQGPGLINEKKNGHFETERIWWVQAECIVGMVNAWQISGDTSYLESAEALWDYIRAHVVDSVHGEWFWAVRPDGSPDPDQPKGGLWKTSYHNGRACMEVISRLESSAT